MSGALNRRTSFTLDAERQQVDNGSIVNAVTLDPQTFAPTPFNDVRTTPQVRVSATPRIDYQLNSQNTVTVRYGFTRWISTTRVSAASTWSRAVIIIETLNQTAQFTDTAVLGTNVVNETRFQFFRSAAYTSPIRRVRRFWC